MTLISEASKVRFKRFFSIPEHVLEVYLTWLGFVAVLFVLFGIIPLIMTINAKYVLLREMRDTTDRINENTSKLEVANGSLVKYTNAMSTFDSYLPLDSASEDYLSDVFLAASRAGFGVSKVYIQKDTQQKTSALVKIDLVGAPNPIDLIKALEDIKRLANVETISVTNEFPRPSQTTVSVRIYFGKAK